VTPPGTSIEGCRKKAPHPDPLPASGAREKKSRSPRFSAGLSGEPNAVVRTVLCTTGGLSGYDCNLGPATPENFAN
jgi:hypothetical protein